MNGTPHAALSVIPSDKIEPEHIAPHNGALLTIIDNDASPRTSDWLSNNPYLTFTDTGDINSPDVPAIKWLIENDGSFAGVMLEEMSQEITVRNGLPWNEEAKQWTDVDDGHLLEYMQRRYRYRGRAIVRNSKNLKVAFWNYVSEHSYNKCTDLLESLPPWDGVHRADTIFIDFLGADDSPYTRAATRIFLRAAIARAFSPGCKYDYMIILKSTTQGIGKSTLVRMLALSDSLFTDSVKGVGSREAQETIQGVWFIEFAELEAFSKAGISSLKNFITQTSDRYRTPYASKATSKPRRCVLVGTTNDDSYLRDPTGNRRFLPITCEGERKLDVMDPSTEEYIKQVWAEVLSEYHASPDVPLVLPAELEPEAESKRNEATIEDPWVGIVGEHLRRCQNPGTAVCVLQVMEEVLGIDRKRAKQSEIMRVASIIAGTPGWVRDNRQRTIPNYGRQRVFVYHP